MKLSDSIVLIDMDDTIAQFGLAMYQRWMTSHSYYPLDPPTAQQSYHVTKGRPAHYTERFHAIMNSVGFFYNLEPMPGAVDALNALRKAGAVVKLCSTPTLNYENCHADKLGWVEQHLGPTWLEDVILTHDKTLVHGSVLIDDKPVITGVLESPSWMQVYFDRPYNRVSAEGVTGTPRLDWTNYLAVLGSL